MKKTVKENHNQLPTFMVDNPIANQNFQTHKRTHKIYVFLLRIITSLSCRILSRLTITLTLIW